MNIARKLKEKTFAGMACIGIGVSYLGGAYGGFIPEEGGIFISHPCSKIVKHSKDVVETAKLELEETEDVNRITGN